MIRDGESIISKCQDIIDTAASFQDLVDKWDDNHPLIEAATKFSEYIAKKMEEAELVSKAKE